MPVHVFGKTLSTTEATVIAGGSALAIWFAYKQHKASSATGAIDPLTGLPASQDTATDPATGQAYLAEAQQYGSVAAAEQALSGSGSGYGYGGGGYGGAGTSTGADLVPATTVAGTTYGSNSAWAQAVEAGLTDIGYSPTDVAAALGRYLSNLSETPAQATIVHAGIAEYGPPPAGSYQVIQAPTGTPVTPAGSWSYPAPGGLHVAGTAAKGVKLQWNPVTGPAGQHPASYTVATYNSSGTEVDQFNANTTTAEEFGRGGGGLPKGTYHTNVWADGGPASPPHATVSYTLTA